MESLRRAMGTCSEAHMGGPKTKLNCRKRTPQTRVTRNKRQNHKRNQPCKTYQPSRPNGDLDASSHKRASKHIKIRNRSKLETNQRHHENGYGDTSAEGYKENYWLKKWAPVLLGSGETFPTWQEANGERYVKLFQKRDVLMCGPTCG